jgi:hypothetical protein
MGRFCPLQTGYRIVSRPLVATDINEDEFGGFSVQRPLNFEFYLSRIRCTGQYSYAVTTTPSRTIDRPSARIVGLETQ